MAKIGFNIPNAKAQLLYDAYAARFGYQEQIFESGQMVPNPESKRAFAQRMIRDQIEVVVKDYEQAQNIVNLPPPEGVGLTVDPDPPGQG